MRCRSAFRWQSIQGWGCRLQSLRGRYDLFTSRESQNITVTERRKCYPSEIKCFRGKSSFFSCPIVGGAGRSWPSKKICFHLHLRGTFIPTKMTEQMTVRGTLKGHSGWVTQIATTPQFPDMILSASRGKFFAMRVMRGRFQPGWFGGQKARDGCISPEKNDQKKYKITRP